MDMTDGMSSTQQAPISKTIKCQQSCDDGNGGSLPNIYLFFRNSEFMRVFVLRTKNHYVKAYDSLKLARINSKLNPCASVGAYKSKIICLGGSFKEEEWKYPTDVLVCNFKRKRKKGVPIRWEDGPKLKGGKPDPLVMTVNGKIYALAGGVGIKFYTDTDNFYSKKALVPNPLFEVWDPESKKGWTALSKPPFSDLYNYPSFPDFVNYTATEGKIYIHVKHPRDRVGFYSFDTIMNKWEVLCYPDGAVNEGIGNKKIVDTVGKCDWEGWADIVDNKLFPCLTDPLDLVLACDLSSPSEELKMPAAPGYESDFVNELVDRVLDDDDGSDVVSSISEVLDPKEFVAPEPPIVDDSVPYTSYDDIYYYRLPVTGPFTKLPVYGLEEVDAAIRPGIVREKLLKYLSEDLFCLVQVYAFNQTRDPKPGKFINICTLRTEEGSVPPGTRDGPWKAERCILAKDVKFTKFEIQPYPGSLHLWFDSKGAR